MPRKALPPDAVRSTMIAVRVTAATKTAIVNAAADDDRSVSDWILQAVKAALKRRDNAASA